MATDTPSSETENHNGSTRAATTSPPLFTAEKESWSSLLPPPPPVASSSSSLFLLNQLPDNLLLLITLYLDTQSFLNLVGSNRRFHQLEKAYETYLWQARVVMQHGGTMTTTTSMTTRGYGDGDTNDWKTLAQQLHWGHGRYMGFSMDAWTNEFLPYPMDITLSNTREEEKQQEEDHEEGVASLFNEDQTEEEEHQQQQQSEIENNNRNRNSNMHPNTLYWRNLFESWTKIQVTKLTRNTATSAVTEIHFSEVELLRGRDILIPNHYHGFFLGRCCIGVFPNGCFFMIRQPHLHLEPMPPPLPDPNIDHDDDDNNGDDDDEDDASNNNPATPESSSSPARNNIPWNNRGPFVAKNIQEKQWEGIASMELVPFNPFEMNRPPVPLCIHLTMKLDGVYSPLALLPEVVVNRLAHSPVQSLEQQTVASQYAQDKAIQGTLWLQHDQTDDDDKDKTNGEDETSDRCSSSTTSVTQKKIFSFPIVAVPSEKNEVDTDVCDFAIFPYLDETNYLSMRSGDRRIDEIIQFIKSSVFYAWYFPSEEDDGDFMFGLHKDLDTRRTGSFCFQQQQQAATERTNHVIQRMMKEAVKATQSRVE